MPGTASMKPIVKPGPWQGPPWPVATTRDTDADADADAGEMIEQVEQRDEHGETCSDRRH